MCLLFPGRYDTIFILNKEDHNMPNGKISEKQIISRAAKQTGHGQDHKAFASKISGYAKESNRECIAEAVADVYCNGSKAKKESRAIVNILKGK